MDFTDAYRLSVSTSASALAHKTFAYSPGSKFFATLHYLTDFRHTIIQVRSSQSLKIIRVWTLEEHAICLSWSKNGSRLLVEFKGGFIVYSLDPSAAANTKKVEEIEINVKVGMEGLVGVYWLDNDSVCTFSADELLANIYNFKSASVFTIMNPKRAKLFPSRTSDYVALLTRSNNKDNIVILSSPRSRRAAFFKGWQVEEQFPIQTNSAVEIIWSPNDCYLAIREDSLEYKVQIYSTLGHLQSSFQIDSNPVLTEEIFENVSSIATTESNRISGGGLGIRILRWAPKNQWLALGGYDERVRILDSQEWSILTCLDLSQKVLSKGHDNDAMGGMIVWREPSDWKQETGGRGIVSHEQINGPVTIPSLRIDMSSNINTNSKSGISWLEWNLTGSLLAIRNDNNPTAIYIYAFTITDENVCSRQPYLLSILLLSSSIELARWKSTFPGANDETRSTLAILTSQGDSVHFWSHSMDGSQSMEAIPIPLNDFVANDFVFAPDGNKMIITSQNGTYCCAVEAHDERMDQAHGSHL